jgi:hypothetical protein
MIKLYEKMDLGIISLVEMQFRTNILAYVTRNSRVVEPITQSLTPRSTTPRNNTPRNQRSVPNFFDTAKQNLSYEGCSNSSEKR